LAGDPDSTDPDGLVKQYYIQGSDASASGGFLWVSVKREERIPVASFRHYDEMGKLLYETEKVARIN
jgi:alkaline phosphatase/alkaline phosphatase D